MQTIVYDPGYVPDGKIKYVAILSRMNGKWVVCRHSERETWEFAGGHIEPGETPDEAARRELFEETGALNSELHPIAVYSVRQDGREESFGMLYFAEILEIGDLPEYEMAEVRLLDEIPQRLTYPAIYPVLLEKVMERMQAHLI